MCPRIFTFSKRGRFWVSVTRPRTHSVTKFSPEYLLNGIITLIVPVDLHDYSDLENDRRTAYDNTFKNHNINKIRFNKNKVFKKFASGHYTYIERDNEVR